MLYKYQSLNKTKIPIRASKAFPPQNINMCIKKVHIQIHGTQSLSEKHTLAELIAHTHTHTCFNANCKYADHFLIAFYTLCIYIKFEHLRLTRE